MGIGKEPSEYKQAMLELKPGMKVNLSGPVGNSHLRDNSPAVLIAGGIGVTPFRSILKQLEADNKQGGKPVHLLYLDSGKSYLYKEELDALAADSSILVTYLDSREELHREIDKHAVLYKNEGKYYIAGPKAMVNSIASYVQDNQISKGNIIKSSFFGYH